MPPSNKEHIKKRIIRQSNQPLRSILPAISFSQRLPAGESHHTPTTTGEKGNTRAACSNCRKHKCKCDGARPSCSKCTKRNEICQYERGQSETASQALRRKIDHLAARKTAHEDVYEMLQSMPEADANRILSIIRRGGDAERVLRLVQEGDLLLQITLKPADNLIYEFPYRQAMPESLSIGITNPYLQSILYRTLRLPERIPQPTQYKEQLEHIIPNGNEFRYARPFHTSQLVEERLDASIPSLWTSIACNDKTMRRIFKAYFRDVPHLYMFFQANYFLDDLVEGRRRYCSSMLVNAVLALGCVYDTETCFKSAYWNPSSLLYQFMTESKRLWELENARTDLTIENKLTTIQSGLILNHIHAFCGIDKLGTKFVEEGIILGMEIGIFEDLSNVSAAEGLRDVMSYTAWAAFCRQSFMAIIYRNGPLLAQQPKFSLPMPYCNTNWYGGELYVSYHPSHKPIPLDSAQIQYSFAKLWTIIHDIVLAMDARPHIFEFVPSNELQRLNDRLLEWFRALPLSLSPERITLPSQISMHMIYYYSVIFLFGSDKIKSFKVSDGDEFSSPDLILTRAHRMLETLIRLFYLRHGSEATATIPISSALIICNWTLDSMKQSHTLDSMQSLRSTVVLCLKILHDQGAIFHVVKILFALVRSNLDDETRLLVPRAIPEQPQSIGNEVQEILQQGPIISSLPIQTNNQTASSSAGPLTEVLEKYQAVPVKS